MARSLRSEGPTIDYAAILVPILSAVFASRLAHAEHRSGVIWGGLALGCWALAVYVFGWGSLGTFLFACGVPSVAMTFANMLRTRKADLAAKPVAGDVSKPAGGA